MLFRSMTIVTLAMANADRPDAQPYFVNAHTIRVPLGNNTGTLLRNFKFAGHYQDEDYALDLPAGWSYYDVTLKRDIGKYVVMYPTTGQWKALEAKNK